MNISEKVRNFSDDLRIDRNDKRKIMFVKTISGTATVIKRISVSADSDMVNFSRKGKNFRKLKYKFDISKPTFRIKNTFYYFIDLTYGQINFESTESDGMKKKVSPEMLDMILNRSIIKQLVSSLEEAPLMKYLIYILLSIGLGGSIGYIIGNAFPM